MDQGFEKIDLSPSESWDIFQNDQHKLHLVWKFGCSSDCVELCSISKTSENMFKLTTLQLLFVMYFKTQSKLLGSIEFSLVSYIVNIYAIQSILNPLKIPTQFLCQTFKLLIFYF